jgi:hypothetical protein
VNTAPTLFSSCLATTWYSTGFLLLCSHATDAENTSLIILLFYPALLNVKNEEEVKWHNGNAPDYKKNKTKNTAVPGWNPAPPSLRQGPTPSVPGCADTWDGTACYGLAAADEQGHKNPWNLNLKGL